MTMPSDSKGRGLVNNLWAQMAILTIVAIIAIALAVKYLW
jgi:LPS O-antigen subunit length determinant protein (WzzB/FepE family)